MLKSKCVSCFQVIAVPTRFKIFIYLRDNDKGVSVNRLVKLTSLKQPTVTFHLNELERKGLVKKERNGKEVFCYLKQNCAACPLFSK